MAFRKYGRKTKPSFPAWIDLYKSESFSSNGVEEVLKTIEIPYLLSTLTLMPCKREKINPIPSDPKLKMTLQFPQKLLAQNFPRFESSE